MVDKYIIYSKLLFYVVKYYSTRINCYYGTVNCSYTVVHLVYSRKLLLYYNKYYPYCDMHCIVFIIVHLFPLLFKFWFSKTCTVITNQWRTMHFTPRYPFVASLRLFQTGVFLTHLYTTFASSNVKRITTREESHSMGIHKCIDLFS